MRKLKQAFNCQLNGCCVRACMDGSGAISFIRGVIICLTFFIYTPKIISCMSTRKLQKVTLLHDQPWQSSVNLPMRCLSFIVPRTSKSSLPREQSDQTNQQAKEDRLSRKQAEENSKSTFSWSQILKSSKEDEPKITKLNGEDPHNSSLDVKSGKSSQFIVN